MQFPRWLAQAGQNIKEGGRVGDLVQAIRGDNVFIEDNALGIVLKVHDNAKSSSFQLITVAFGDRKMTWPRRTITRLVGNNKQIKELNTCS